MTSSRGGYGKDDGWWRRGGRGSENPEFVMTSFVNAPLKYYHCHNYDTKRVNFVPDLVQPRCSKQAIIDSAYEHEVYFLAVLFTRLHLQSLVTSVIILGSNSTDDRNPIISHFLLFSHSPVRMSIVRGWYCGTRYPPSLMVGGGSLKLLLSSRSEAVHFRKYQKWTLDRQKLEIEIFVYYNIIRSSKLDLLM